MPGFFGLAFGMLRGRLGWVNVILMLVQASLFVAGIYAAIMFFSAAEPVAQLRWGLPAAVLLLMSLIVKMGMWPILHIDRLMREGTRFLETVVQIPRTAPSWATLLTSQWAGEHPLRHTLVGQEVLAAPFTTLARPFTSSPSGAASRGLRSMKPR